MSDLRKKFDEIYLTQSEVLTSTGSEKKDAKKKLKELMSQLSDDEKSQYLRYKNTADVYIQELEDIGDAQKQARVGKDSVPVFTESAKKERKRRFVKERDEIFQTFEKNEEDALIEEAFAEMEKTRYEIPSESSVVKTSFYQPEMFVKTPWDIPNLTLRESETLPLDKQQEILQKREKLDIFKNALKDGDEVEIRFGMQKDRYFDSQVPKDAFENILKHLEKEGLPEPSTTTSYIKSEKVVDTVYNKEGLPVKDRSGKVVKKQFRENVRIIDTENGTRVIERKRVLNMVTSTNWGVRLQSARETQLPSSEISKYDVTSKDFVIRQKTRWRIPVSKGDNLFFYDLTKVVDPRNRKNVRYEVEIELSKFSGDLLKLVKEQTMKMYSIMQDVTEDQVISPKNLMTLMSNYNQIFIDMKNDPVEFADVDLGAMSEMQKSFDPYSFYNIENKPRAFNFKNVASDYDYRVTPKLDGLRKRLFIDANGIFEVNPRTGFARLIVSQINVEPGTIIDTEYYNGRYFPFDVLAFEGRNIINLYFDQRMGKIVEKVKVKDGERWKVDNVGLAIPFVSYEKPFYGFPKGNVYDFIKEAFDWMDNSDFEFDGLILQRNDEPYWEPYPKVTSTMKWKPMDEITVDLLTKITSDNLVELYSVNPTVKGGNHPGLQKEMFTKDVVTYTDLEIPEEYAERGDFIAEYYFEKEEPHLRFKDIRADKTEPNFHSVVKSNRDSFFRNPVTREDLLGQTLKTWRKWASSLKRDIVNETIPDGMRILDIGVGRGGGALFDMSRKAAKVYGIDPDTDNLEDLRERLSGTGFTDEQKERIVVANLKGQDREKILELLGDERVDVITMFFSVSFFFKSMEDLDALMDTIDKTANNRRKGAMLIIQMMDGEKILDTLLSEGAKYEKSYSVGNDVYKVKLKMYKTLIGTPLTLTLPTEEDTIIGTGKNRGKQKEWVASVSMLDSLLEKIGFKKISDDFMDRDSVLPESNREFAAINRSLIYVRGGGPIPISQRTTFKSGESLEDDMLTPLSEDKKESLKDYERIGVVADKSAFLRSMLYHISKEYRNGDSEIRSRKVKQLRKTLHRLIDEDVFETMIGGNVQHNITYDKLYSKAYDTMNDGKQVDVVYDKNTAKDAAFNEYKNRLLDGYVGFEIAEAAACLWDVKITIVDESGTGVFIANPDGSKKSFSILKIGNVSFEPLK